MKSPLSIGVKNLCLFLVCISSMLYSGCNNVSFRLPSTNTVTTIKIKSIPMKIAVAAGSAALQVALEEFAGIQIDSKDLLNQVSSEDASKGVPPTDVPVLMLVNKKTNDILYWKLNDRVKIIRLRHEHPGAIELKVVNETPLRIELWMDGDIKDVSIAVEMKE